MFFDALTAAAVADELRATVLNGFVQKTVLPDAHSLALEVYRAGMRHHLLITIHPEHPRALLLDERPTPQPGLVTPLGLLVRKYVLDGVVNAVEQQAGERSIALSITKRSEGHNTTVWLAAELMGRHSNLLLLDEARGVVLDSIKRVPASMSRSRPVLPKQPYTPPPPRAGIQPHHATAQALEAACGGRDVPLAQALVGAVAGLSPLAAREAVHRAGGAASATAAGWKDWSALAAGVLNLASLWSTHDWQPTIARTDTGIAAYAPYRLTHLSDAHTIERADTISRAIREYTGKPAHLVEHSQIRNRLLAGLEEHERKLRARLTALQGQQSRAGEAQQLMENGQLILGYSWQIGAGDSMLKVEGRAVQLDRSLSPAENAERLFEEYRKRRRAAQELPALLDEVTQQIEAVREFHLFVELAEGHAELTALQAEAQAAGLLPRSGGRTPVRKPPPAQPLKLSSAEGVRILVGRSALQNERVLELGAPDDWWFHARGVPGGHVVARTGGREPSGDTLRLASQAAAYYSSARGGGNVEVVYCQLKHVRKVKGGSRAQVTYRNEKSLLAEPRSPDRTARAS